MKVIRSSTFVFTTPECTAMIDSYLEYRKRSGELLNPNSYLIREAFDNNDIRQVKELSRPVATSTLRACNFKLFDKNWNKEKTISALVLDIVIESGITKRWFMALGNLLPLN